MRTVANILRGRQEAEKEAWNRTWWLAANFIGTKNMPKLPWQKAEPAAQRPRPEIWDKWDEDMKKRHGRQ